MPKSRSQRLASTAISFHNDAWAQIASAMREKSLMLREQAETARTAMAMAELQRRAYEYDQIALRIERETM